MSFIPFSEDEIVKGPDGKYTINYPIPPKENYLRACKRDNPQWLPLQSDTKIFNPRIYPDNVARAYVIEGKPFDGPKGGKDIFGIPWEYIPVAGGSMITPGTPPLLDDISEWKEKVVFPDIDSWDWEGSAAENREYLNDGRITNMWIFNGMFERLISFLEFENAAMALIDEDQQDDVKELFQALVEFYKNLIDHFIKYYGVDIIYFHDDWGSQRSPFFSLATCREMLVPYLKQIVDHCHQNGLLFNFHCCGKNEALVPAMIECGMDIWCGQPLNDKVMLLKEYGDKIFIGVHSPYNPKIPTPAPADDAVLEQQITDFLAPYLPYVKERPIFVMDLRPDDRQRAFFYRHCREALDPTK